MCWVKGKKKVNKDIAKFSHNKDPAIHQIIVFRRSECPPKTRVKVDHY